MQKMEASVRNIFFAFLKMGAFAFGGVDSMIAFFERELVLKRKWLSHDDFAESVVVGQLTPGPPIINSGIFIGYLLRGTKGALATVVGQVLPSFVMILILAYVYMNDSDIPIMRLMLWGVWRPLLVGLVVSVVFRMGKRSLKDYKSVCFAIVTFICLAAFKLNPIVLIIAAGVGGLIVYRGGALKWQ